MTVVIYYILMCSRLESIIWDPTVSTGAGECRILSFKFSIMRGREDRCDAQRHELEDFEHLPKDQILTM